MADTSATLNEIDSLGIKLKLTDNSDGTYSLSTSLSSDSVEMSAEVEGRNGDGTAKGTIKPVLVGGQDGTNIESLKTDSTGRVETREVASTATLANVDDSATSVTLQAANTARLGWACFNDSTEVLYIKFGATASATSFTVKVGAGGYYEMPKPIYTGIIDGIWANNSSGAARVTELT